ncbi:MAG TPA: energy-coupling factor ABC transporter permease, partial [Polyangiaceae bacterium]|nr:energy-coupling factor ABC transporter permease [Polyangiaceae bacterium]
MHLPDGIVSATPLTVALDVVGVGTAALALRGSRFDRQADLAWSGTIAAFLLALQALNVPLVPGVSAHAIGATLAVLTLGPARAILALTAVLLIQALLLGDGGITVLGINALTIAILPVLSVQGFRRLFAGSARGLELSAIAGSVTGNVAAASLLTLTLVDGAGAPLALTAGWLIGVHALTGAVEGVLTAIALRRLAARAPWLIARSAPTSAPIPVFRVALVAAAL